jgi:hypothetical protein
LLNKIRHYFLLERPVLGDSKGVKHEVILFTGVVVGTAGQWLFAALTSGKFVWQGLILGFIASIVTFPAIYYNAGLNKTDPKKPGLTFVRWCVAFQNGFFWPSLLEQVGRGFKSST